MLGSPSRQGAVEAVELVLHRGGGGQKLRGGLGLKHHVVDVVNHLLGGEGADLAGDEAEHSLNKVQLALQVRDDDSNSRLRA